MYEEINAVHQRGTEDNRQMEAEVNQPRNALLELIVASPAAKDPSTAKKSAFPGASSYTVTAVECQCQCRYSIWPPPAAPPFRARS